MQTLNDIYQRFLEQDRKDNPPPTIPEIVTRMSQHTVGVLREIAITGERQNSAMFYDRTTASTLYSNGLVTSGYFTDGIDRITELGRAVLAYIDTPPTVEASVVEASEETTVAAMEMETPDTPVEITVSLNEVSVKTVSKRALSKAASELLERAQSRGMIAVHRDDLKTLRTADALDKRGLFTKNETEIEFCYEYTLTDLGRETFNAIDATPVQPAAVVETPVIPQEYPLGSEWWYRGMRVEVVGFFGGQPYRREVQFTADKKIVVNACVADLRPIKETLPREVATAWMDVAEFGGEGVLSADNEDMTLRYNDAHIAALLKLADAVKKHITEEDVKR